MLQADEYSKALEAIMIKEENGLKVVPELYAVPSDKVSKMQPFEGFFLQFYVCNIELDL